MNRSALALMLCLAGCDDAPARPQWVVNIATDAPVPQFGDRLRVEVLRDGEPASRDATREFDVAAAMRWPVSLGVVPSTDGGTLMVRARLYRTDHLTAAGELTGSFIDAIGRLPGDADPGQVALKLELDCFGLAAEVDAGLSCETETRGLQPVKPLPATADLPTPGSWPHAPLVDCREAPPAGMVCVPGGAFVLGSALSLRLDERTAGLPERLVVLSPFAIDVREFSVGEMETLVGAGMVTTPPGVPPSQQTVSRAACTYGRTGTDDDALPVNCVSFETAQQACAAVGKRLPTEAEWEYVAGNLQQESTYPWGEANEVCERATLGVGRVDAELTDGTSEWASCRNIAAETTPGWGLAATASDGDVTELGVWNMAGSVNEHVRDQFASYTAPCWQPGAGPIFDPVCNTADDDQFSLALRGGHWAGPPFAARAFARNATEDLQGGQDVATGFRCAADM